MEHEIVGPSLTIALALAGGIIAQSAATHIRLPGIVLLLAFGVVLGPDLLDVVRPATLGSALPLLVDFAIAVILFEGGMNLRIGFLRREHRVIRPLLTIGPIITTAGAAAAAHYIIGWDWAISVLFGTIVIVTGPTVVTPLLVRIGVTRKVERILESEGIFIDAIGAIIAVSALEIVLNMGDQSIVSGLMKIPLRIGAGGAVGIAGGFIIALLLRVRGLIPEGYENVFALTVALAIFQGADVIMAEAGIPAVIMAGLVVGNMKIPGERGMKEFKEQLTVLFIGMLFILLAADVRFDEMMGLGYRGPLLVVAALVLLVRPIEVLVCTLRSDLRRGEKGFIGWMAPRGIVAAAVASHFNDLLSEAGMPGVEGLRGLVFFVIAATVVVYGLTGAPVARLLGVKKPTGLGYGILGAHELGRALAKVLKRGGQEVVLLDTNHIDCSKARAEGLDVVNGSALSDLVLRMADMSARKGAISVLANEATGLLFVAKSREDYKVPNGYVAIHYSRGAVTPDMVHDARSSVLFGSAIDIDLWSVRLRRELTTVSTWRYEADGEESEGDAKKLEIPRSHRSALLPLAVAKGDKFEPYADRVSLKKGMEVAWLMFSETAAATEWLSEQGWSEVIEPAPDSPQ